MLTRRVLLRQVGTCRSWSRTAACCAGEEQAALDYSPPIPGTVPQHDHHVLLSLPGMGDETRLGASWPSLVEREAAMLLAFTAVARHRDAIAGRVKITAMEPVPGRLAPAEGTCHMMAFPSGLAYRDLALAKLGQAVAHAVADNPRALPGLDKDTLLSQVRPEERGPPRLHVFVCCHGSRDARCGARGPALVTALRRAAREAGLAERVVVAGTSHVGGHRYAGNVVVHGAFHPCDGDWFGGLQATHAADFVAALRDVELGCDGGAEHPTLRQWWRGRMGLSADEQVQLFESGGGLQLEQAEPGTCLDDEQTWTEAEEELWRERHPEHDSEQS